MTRLAAVAELPIASPAIVNATLPATYEAARTAIAECDRIDECKTWADKAAALASYARQARDDSLAVMARRIQARALRRGGELLKQVYPANGARTDLGPVPTRSDAAEAAGLSERQRKTALRVASISESQFNRQVESAKPPTVTQLANQGKASRAPTQAAPGNIPAREPAACKAIAEFARLCGQINPTVAGLELTPHEAMEVRQHVSKIDSWLDRFMSSLPT
jgi:hypothetical protein